MLRVEDLSVPHPRLKNKNLVEKISFSVRRGEVLGIAGLVGSGRSEVVNAIYGRIPRCGRVFVEGLGPEESRKGSGTAVAAALKAE